jgi:hypothetical protein
MQNKWVLILLDTCGKEMQSLLGLVQNVVGKLSAQSNLAGDTSAANVR